MTTITSDTSIMDFLGGSASSQYFSALEEQNDLTQEQLDRQKNVEDELASMTDAITAFEQSIKASFNQSVRGIKDSITNPINSLKADSISAYTQFTESIYEMRDGVTQKLTDVKDGFSSKVDNLRTGFTDAVAMTNSALDSMSVKMEAFSNLPTEKQILLAGKTIADGVMNTVTAIPDVISSGMEKLDKGIGIVGGFVKSSSGYLKGLFQKSEEGDDVGGTSGLAPKAKKPDSNDDGEGIGGLLGSIPLPKGMKSGLSKFGKFAGKFAGKLALPLAVIASGVSFVDGIQNASEIVGKSADEISSLEKAGAGLSSLVSDLTFGLISAETIYSEGKQVIDGISGFASDMYAKLPDGVRAYTDKVGDFLFSSKGGVFQSVGDLFSSTIDAIGNGDWGTVALNTLLGPMKMMFGGDGILANTAKGVFDLLPSSFQESITGFADTIMGWFDNIKNMASNLIPDSLKNFFNDVSESDTGKAIGENVSKGVDAVKGFFGWGSDAPTDTKPVASQSIAQKAPVVTKYGNGNPALEAKLAENRAIIAQNRNKKQDEIYFYSY